MLQPPVESSLSSCRSRMRSNCSSSMLTSEIADAAAAEVSGRTPSTHSSQACSRQQPIQSPGSRYRIGQTTPPSVHARHVPVSHRGLPREINAERPQSGTPSQTRLALARLYISTNAAISSTVGNQSAESCRCRVTSPPASVPSAKLRQMAPRHAASCRPAGLRSGIVDSKNN